MGGAASNRFIPSPSKIVPIDESVLLLGNKLHALWLILKNEDFAHAFRSFVEDNKHEKKLVFVRYYAELERLKLAMLQKKRSLMGDENLSTVRDLVLNNSAKIYLLFYPRNKANKDHVDLHYEGLVAQCLLPLLSLAQREAASGNCIVHDCYERLSSCQSSLLVHLVKDLECFVTSPHFQPFQTSSILVQQSIYHQVILNTQSNGFDYEDYVRNSSSSHSEETDDNNSWTTQSSLSSSTTPRLFSI